MIKLNVKSLAIGVVIGSVCTTGVSFAAVAGLTQISVDLNPVAIKIDDKLVEQSKANTFNNGKTTVPLSMVYQGTTYVPLRFLSEALNKQVEWSDRSISIKNKGILAGSIESSLTYDGQGSLLFTIKNQTEDVQALTFNTGQRYDYIIWDDKGQRIQQYSSGRMFNQLVSTESLKQGEEKTYTAPLSRLKKGKYKAEFWLATQSANLSKTIPFEVTQDLTDASE
ncbi:BsuPI-related putative proteinase inhibitor [Aneurinibacillus sp. Ricciae_BoGa-3]|uniref:BsuPI-related putative proteinase inhibitor n=1 Tax=Aneurinibacillus sp. Ricciae_BoGa-3 TaxID=3022697 RepID=UPI00233FA108|nr:BsuPI-related putative proteinase inhibitor [Aneurinibacillus sp. Ricciae_BoGa-3]WCK54022.1 BsuPI-related putative proteinase inhibitor [Aneurinibacillus sp. Ricciae_BoGa-3]